MVPRVFVLIPVYNAEAFLAEAIQSVIDQTYKDWKLVVLDDASTDNSFGVAKKFQQVDPRITVFRNEYNRGMIDNWNYGISLCQCEFFVKLDGDDVWHPQMLEKGVAILDHQTDVALVFSKYATIDFQGKIIETFPRELPDFAAGRSFSCVPLVNENSDNMLRFEILRQGVSVLRASVFGTIGTYLPIRSADTEFYFRVGCHYTIYCLEDVLYYYRIHDSSDSSDILRNMDRGFYLYQVKNAIVDYYYSQGKISNVQYRWDKKAIDLKYCFFLINKFRSQKRWFKALERFVLTFFKYPVEVLQFYWGRLISRFE